MTYHLIHKKRYKSADIKGEKLSGVAPNIVPKGLKTLRPNAIWCNDITHLKADGKHAYLHLVMDYHSRKIIGWHLSQTMEPPQTLKALITATEWKSHSVRGYLSSLRKKGHEINSRLDHNGNRVYNINQPTGE